MTKKASREYASAWEHDAKYFLKNMHYAWMIERLSLPRSSTVLEVGCGAGISTYSLVRQGFRVVSIENNKHMIELAVNNLRKGNVTVEVIDFSDFGKVDSIKANVVIVCADILDFVVDEAVKFDGILLWLFGSFPEKIAVDYPGWESPKYRFVAIRKCFELGVRLLKPQGVVQVVDRYGFFVFDDNEAKRRGMHEIYSELAGQGYEIGMRDLVIHRMSGDYHKKSRIQYVNPLNVDNVSFIPVLASVRATLK